MSRADKRTLDEQAERELRAIDAALNGEGVSGEHASLRELALSLRTTRSRPSEDFLRALDARAERGFQRKPPQRAGVARPPIGSSAGGSRVRRGWGVASAISPRPALGVAVAAVLAVLAVAIPLSLSGGGAPVAARAPLSAAGEAVVSRPSKVQAQGALASGAPVTSPAGGQPPVPTGAGTRQIERTATLDIGVASASVQSAAQRVFTLVSAFGGYVAQSSVSSGEGARAASGAAEGGASFQVRLPSARLPSAIAALSQLGHVRSETDTTNDVTGQWHSLSGSLAELRAQRASLIRQLAATSDARRAQALNARIHAVDGRISGMLGALRALSGRINYTGLALSLTSEASAGATSGDLTPAGAARDAARILDAALAVLVLAAAALLPLLALLAAVWTMVMLARRRAREHALDAG